MKRTTYRIWKSPNHVDVQVISAGGRHLSFKTFYTARQAAAWLALPERAGSIIDYRP